MNLQGEAFAHSIADGPRSEWQPLEEHLRAVAEYAASFGSTVGLHDWCYLAGLWHDLGKYSPDFQNYILRASTSEDVDNAHIEGGAGRVDHSTAGAKWAASHKHLGIASRLLSYPIVGHHGGLPDFEPPNGTGLRTRLHKDIPRYEAPEEILFPDVLSPPATPSWLNGARRGFTLSFAVRMVFSCLVDADFLDTERFYNPDSADSRGRLPTVTELVTHLETALRGFDKLPRTTVNRVRDEVSRSAIERAKELPGFFSLTVPTGGGKTLSSVRFALNHARHHGKGRVIYGIPYTSIIEQTAETFRRIFGEESVVEHHSNVEPDPDGETSHSRLAAENWDAPLVVTTNVQLFESLFSNRTSRCRKLHNIANSVIVLDEAQMLPVSLLLPTLAALCELVDHYGCTVLLCSATQPALRAGDHLREGLEEVREIVPDPVSNFERLRRVRFEFLGKVDAGELGARLAEHSQVLCVVNSRREAQETYLALAAVGDAFYLSTYLCPAHRAQVFEKIRARLRDGRPCRVVSTQLIEAGVDIDFPVVFRAAAGIDSIAQAAGRCNRNGQLNELGAVYLFEGERPAPPGFLRRTAQLGAEILATDVDPLHPDTVARYFKRLYRYEGDGLDARNILTDLIERDEAFSLQFPFEEIAERYKLISSEQVAVVVRFDGTVPRLLSELEFGGAPRRTLRKLQPYTISIPKRIASELQARGDVRVVADVIAVLERKDLYDATAMGFFMKEFADMDQEALVQ